MTCICPWEYGLRARIPALLPWRGFGGHVLGRAEVEELNDHLLQDPRDGLILARRDPPEPVFNLLGEPVRDREATVPAREARRNVAGPVAVAAHHSPSGGFVPAVPATGSGGGASIGAAGRPRPRSPGVWPAP